MAANTGECIIKIVGALSGEEITMCGFFTTFVPEVPLGKERVG